MKPRLSRWFRVGRRRRSIQATGTPISSFLCSSEVFARFLDCGIDCGARTLCFAVLRAIANGALEVDRLLVRQVPFLQRAVIWTGNCRQSARFTTSRRRGISSGGAEIYREIGRQLAGSSCGPRCRRRRGIRRFSRRISRRGVFRFQPCAGGSVCNSPGIGGKVAGTASDLAGFRRSFVLRPLRCARRCSGGNGLRHRRIAGTLPRRNTLTGAAGPVSPGLQRRAGAPREPCSSARDADGAPQRVLQYRAAFRPT